MSRMTDLVMKLEQLINEYGADTVRNGFEFVTTFNTQARIIVVRDATGLVTCELTREQYMKVYDAYVPNPGSPYTNKIQAIKALREITGIGLKEAKDVVENERWSLARGM